jgi:hypothetical protein
LVIHQLVILRMWRVALPKALAVLIYCYPKRDPF